MVFALLALAAYAYSDGFRPPIPRDHAHPFRLIPAKRLAEKMAQEAATSHQSPSTSSGMKPTYLKPSAVRGEK